MNVCISAAGKSGILCGELPANKPYNSFADDILETKVDSGYYPDSV